MAYDDIKVSQMNNMYMFDRFYNEPAEKLSEMMHIKWD